jgi:hypothetical protein
VRFESRDLQPYAEPISADELEVGRAYFAVRFVDSEMIVPYLDPLIFLGAGSRPVDVDRLYFQDAGSYLASGSALAADLSPDARLYAQRRDQINDIFDYERALDVLLRCSLRRRARDER